MSTIERADRHPVKINLWNHARAHYTPTSVIVDGLFETNNYDGVKANKDWQIMHKYEKNT